MGSTTSMGTEIEALKDKSKKSSFSDEEREELRKKVAKIIEKREREEQQRLRESMERFYEFNLHT